MDHILEIHHSSLHHTKIQVRLIKSNSIFQKKHTTSQIAEQVATYFASVVLSAMLHPAKPVAHIGSQTEEATQGSLLLSGATNLNQHNHAS